MPRRKTLSDEAVLDAALGVMVEKGPTDFTLADIGRAAGLAPATLVQRFGSKQELVVAAFTLDNDRFGEALNAAPKTRGAAAVIALFLILTPAEVDVALFADQLLWLRQDMRDPHMNTLARIRFSRLRAAIAERLPPLAMAPIDAARLIEAQWHGALNQWGLEPEGRLVDYVTRALADWFALVQERGG